MTTDTEKKYPLMFGKMVKRGTRFVEDAYQQGNYPLGIYIDIFPYDKTSENERLRTKHQKKTWFWARLQVLTLIPVSYTHLDVYKRQVIRTLLVFIWLCYILTPLTCARATAVYKITIRGPGVC